MIVIEYGMGGEKGRRQKELAQIAFSYHWQAMSFFCSQPMRSTVFAYQLRHLYDVAFHTAACSPTSFPSFQQEQQQQHVFVFLNASSFRVKGGEEAQK